MKYNYQDTFYSSTSLDKTYKYALDVEKRPEWQSALKSARLLDEEPIKLGSLFEEDGQTGIMVLEFVELEINKRIRYKTVKGKGAFADISWDFETKENQTQLHLSITLIPQGIYKILFPLIFPIIIKPQIKKEFGILKNELDKLK